MLWFTGSQRVGHDLAIELNWNDADFPKLYFTISNKTPFTLVMNYLVLLFL